MPARERMRVAGRVAAMAAVTIPLSLILLLRVVFSGSRAARRRARARTQGEWCRFIARIVGMRIAVEGTPPKPPFLLVSNHTGYVDILLLASRCEGLFVARGDLARWPLLGPLSRMVGTLFVDRGRKTDVPRVLAEIRERLGDGVGIILFPEGTSTAGDRLLPFRSPLLEAAVRTDLPVWTAAVSYRTLPGSPPAGDVVCWSHDEDFFLHAGRVLALPGFEARVRFGDVPMTGKERKQLARDLRAEIGRLLGQPALAPQS